MDWIIAYENWLTAFALLCKVDGALFLLGLLIVNLLLSIVVSIAPGDFGGKPVGDLSESSFISK